MKPARLRLALLVSALACAVAGSAFAAPRVNLLTIRGSINPASAAYIVEGVEQSERDGADALLIELDTPGGLVTATKDIIQAILNSKVPVIVYVAPRGAWAASAGMYITVSAHVAAMAPSSSIGAAHPVSPMGGNEAPAKPAEGEEAEKSPVPVPAIRDLSAEKAENLLAAYIESIAKEKQRNVEWVEKAVRESVAVGESEALDLGVIDLVAGSRSELFEQIEGREVEVDGETTTLALSGAQVVAIEMSLVQSIFDFLADPNVAVILVLL
ncbi:MAG: nodulation protein NfeD, partial [Myxococcota bacterium]